MSARAHWVCRVGCAKEFDSTEQFAAHLKKDHGLINSPLRGKKKMTLHLDAAREAISAFEWEIEGFTYHQTVVAERARR